MTKSELIDKRIKEHKERYGENLIGKYHVLNPVPTNEKESVQHGNALAISGNYPVGTSECFNVGISGGCGPDCFVYQKDECDEPDGIETKEVTDG